MGGTGYVWGLDLIRFTAALMVAFFHLSWQQSNPQITFDPGWVGVEVFFVLSGFVIMGSASNARPIEFLERRFARLYPAAIACLLVDFTVVRPFQSLVSAQHFHTTATADSLIHSLLLVSRPFLVSALWTLPIELAFYLLIFLALILGCVSRVTLIATSLIVWSGLYEIPFVLTEYGLGPLHAGELGSDVYNWSLLRYGCFFGVGMLVWQIGARRPRGTELTALLVGMALCWAEIIARSADLRLSYAYFVSGAVLTEATLLLFTLSVLALWGCTRINNQVHLNPPMRQLLRRVGLMTYPLYLTHEAVGGVAFSLTRRSGYGQGLGLAAGIAMSLLVSLLVVEFVEPWLRRLLLAVVHPMLVHLTTNPRMSHLVGTFSHKS